MIKIVDFLSVRIETSENKPLNCSWRAFDNGSLLATLIVFGGRHVTSDVSTGALADTDQAER